MTPDENQPLDQDSLSSSDSGSQELDGQVAQLIRLVGSGDEANIKLAFLLAKGLGNPAPFGQYLDELLMFYQLAFESKRKKKLDAPALTRLFQLTQLDIARRNLTALPESLGALHQLQELNCHYNDLKAYCKYTICKDSIAVITSYKLYLRA